VLLNQPLQVAADMAQAQVDAATVTASVPSRVVKAEQETPAEVRAEEAAYCRGGLVMRVGWAGQTDAGSRNGLRQD
jgi:hypothetical protein